MIEEKILKDARISDPYIDRRSGEDRGWFMTQIILKMVVRKEEVVKSEGNDTKDGRTL